MSQTLIQRDPNSFTTIDGRYMVLIYNNSHTSIEDVIDILMSATGCDKQEASIETWEAHHYGKAPVHFSSKYECDKIATTIGTIGVKAEVAPEWKD